ncbi:MAG: quinohemoprotein amine dehydrogenase subunit alpha [Sphaerochaetaceae bacterium]|nr:quinohemoprotein amine dehydrogenase subunit alpha [Sphaerochaetaceae bacterium]
MKTTYLKSVFTLSIGCLVSTVSLNATDFIEAKSIIDSKCIACHTGSLDSSLSRISEQRKTPEGWYMTISRMENSHGLVLSDIERKSVVKYLADTQGLNPSESEPYRYILEKTPNYQETPTFDTSTTEACARCHSEARIGLQRRTAGEWNNLIEFHLGQFPTLEYQSLSRDREWFKIAKNEIVPLLTEKFGNDTKFEKIEANYGGTWTLYGHKLGDGDFTATMKAEKTSKDVYSLTLKGEYLDGRELSATGEAIVYSGYEWRATLNFDGITVNQVFKMDSKTNTLEGSMFETLHSEEHSFVKGAKVDSKSLVLGVYPTSIKAGTSSVVTISGVNLKGDIKLSSGLKVNKILEKTASKIVLDVTASSKYDSKQIDLSIGSLKLDNELVIYKKVEGLKVYPSYAIARVGDGGGKMPKQHAIFEAYGYLAGKDGKIGTSDDISLGKIDAKWSVAPFDERAKEDEDVKYTGTMDSFSGRFTPSFAGPNPKRRFGTNNAGNLKVFATYKDENETLKADSHLIVTVQKWVNSPIN